MKKTTVLLTMLSLVCLFAGCNGKETVQNESRAEQKAEALREEPEEQTELIVFAAASMTETLEEIAKVYSEKVPEVKIVYNFDSSGTLKTQIEEGADCDIFISASGKQMNQLDISADKEINTEGLDFIDPKTRMDILENKVTLAVPEGNPRNINSYEDMVQGLKDKTILLAMGNEDVPVGQYTQKIFEYFGLDEQELSDAGVITYGSNVKEVTTQVKEGAVDCGIIYSTDAYSAGLKVVDTSTEEMCGRVIYPAAVLKASKVPGEAEAFLDYLSSEECKTIFEKVGFTCIN
ncbi:MAG: molybdate ABC transporter substrate-binding protein [Lachnospiraceae bacterium]|nr:molybdate ABC transporter substrate-binding protein [Lachnospiraceae bacterium]